MSELSGILPRYFTLDEMNSNGRDIKVEAWLLLTNDLLCLETSVFLTRFGDEASRSWRALIRYL